MTASDDNRQAAIVAVNAVMAALALIAVCCRVLARKLSRNHLWWDDWCIFVALLLFLAEACAHFFAVHHGLGKHSTPESLAYYLRDLYFDEITYNIALAMVKYSILFFYVRIFPVRFILIGVWTIGAIVTGWAVATTFAIIFQCSPIRKTWDKSVVGTCIDVTNFFIGQAIPHIFTDILILCLPLKTIWELQQPTSHKVALGGVFLLGSFATACSIIRLVILIDLPEDDITWTWNTFDIWSVVEPAISIVCACCPSLLPLARRMFRWVGKSYASSRRSRRFDSHESTTRKFTGDRWRHRDEMLDSANFVRLEDGLQGFESDRVPLADGRNQHLASAETHGHVPSGIELNEIHVQRMLEVTEEVDTESTSVK